MSQQGRHHVLRITVPADAKEGVKAFSKAEVCLEGSAFEDAVQSYLGCGGDGLVRVECVWRGDPRGTQYQGGSKAYCLTVVQTASDHQDKERVLAYPQCPLLLLCCSVFPQQAQAEAYARAHLPTHPESGEDVFAPVRDVLAGRISALHLPQEALSAAHLCCTLLLLLQDVQPNVDTAAQTPPLETLRQLFRFVQSPAARLRALRQQVLCLCQLLHTQPAEGTADARAEAGPALALQLQHLLQDCVTEAEPLSSWCRHSQGSLERLRSRLQAACGQLVLGPRRTALTELRETLRQLFRFVQSPAARLRALRQQVLCLCQLLHTQPAEGTADARAEAGPALALQLQHLLQDCVTEAEPLSSWCRHSQGSLERLRSRLQAACGQLVLGPRRTALTELREWCSSSSVLESQLVSDTLPWVPLLKELVQQAEQGEEGTQEQAQERTEQSALWEQELLYCTPNTLDLTLESAGDPSHLSARLSQYLVDCAVDQCWERCLWKVLSLSPLPVNPFPSLAQEFRLEALRMSLWRQSDAEVQKQMRPLETPQPCPAGPPLHCGPGEEGYGLPSALRASHPHRLRDCLSRAQSLECEPQYTGRFKVERSTAVLSPRAWLGTLSPFLCGLQVIEFCYITAPPGCLDEVLQVYAKLVLAGLSELCGRDGLIVGAVHLGPGGLWDMQQLTAFPTHFLECFSDALRHRHPVHLRVFQAPRGSAEWRFIPLQKLFVLYCLREDGSSWLCLPQHNLLSLHQAVFPSLDQATFHFNTVGRESFISGSVQEVMSQLDSEITEAFLKTDFLHGYRLVAMRGLLSGEEACLPDCWRGCHSLCSQTEFLCAVAECLQGLLELCGEDERAEPRQTATEHQTAIEHMFEGFSWMLRRTLEHPEALAPPGLWEVVLQGQGAVAGGSRAVWLRGTAGVCRAISETLSQDLLSLCPTVQALLERLDSMKEREEARAHICCTETLPPNSQPLRHRSPEHSEQSPSQSIPLTGAQALALF
ncbi:uncharacterized protein LOC133121295 [Conger conger]|uniref:uncharacterized protein LOC133121295 n=1 Tax=Conger conger TaxID=82655 RepID=UPI002A59E28F|nr:uncharacterized protein LOC133121295 [Conger conger]